MFDALATSLGSDALLFSEDLRILRVYGDVSQHLVLNEQSRLQFNASVLRPELELDVRTNVAIALRRNERRRGLPHRLDEESDQFLQLEVFPLKTPELDEPVALVTISKFRSETENRSIELETGKGASNEHVDALLRELGTTRDELHQAIEELETSNEELRTSNEEMQSSNEELQATNEELESSNEELQSTNEELVTVNEELQVSTTELSILNDEQDAIINNMTEPLLVIDLALQIAKANDAAIGLFRIKQPVDRPHLSLIHI